MTNIKNIAPAATAVVHEGKPPRILLIVWSRLCDMVDQSASISAKTGNQKRKCQ